MRWRMIAENVFCDTFMQELLAMIKNNNTESGVFLPVIITIPAAIVKIYIFRKPGSV